MLTDDDLKRPLHWRKLRKGKINKSHLSLEGAHKRDQKQKEKCVEEGGTAIKVGWRSGGSEGKEWRMVEWQQKCVDEVERQWRKRGRGGHVKRRR